MMPLAALVLFTTWIVLAFASPDIDGTRNGRSEFHVGIVLPRQQQGGTNLQVFSEALGGAGASAITNSGDPERPYEVDGDTFVCHTPPALLFFLKKKITSKHPGGALLGLMGFDGVKDISVH